MRDELYINGIKADLLENHVNLNYSSNLLTDVGKIVSNNSYTVKLPMTAENLKFIECAHIPSSESRFPYIRHAAKIVRDGVEIVSGANVVLLSVTDCIEIALTWGNINNLSPVADKSLRDLEYTLEDYVTWQVGENSREFPLIDYGFGSNKSVWYHPAVSVKWILEQISRSTGVTFDLPADREAELEEMFIPLLERNDSELNANANTIQMGAAGITSETWKILRFNTDKNDCYYCSVENGNTVKNKNQAIKVLITGYVKMEAEADLGIPNSSGKVYLGVRNKTISYAPVLAGVPAEVEHIAGNRYSYTFTFRDAEIEMPAGGEVSFILYDSYTSSVDKYTISVVQGHSGTIYLKPMFERVELGGKYYFVPNLPDIKQIDFIKAISSMLGLFLIPTSLGHLKFVSFDELTKNKAKAEDWTKLVVYTRDPLPQSIGYTLDDTARFNRFRYQDEETYDGVIEIKNRTLELERDAAVLPFAPSKTINGVACIPLYSFNDGKLEYDPSVTPRILRYQENTGTFLGLSWNSLLDRYYDFYRKVVQNAKVITERVCLDSVRLKNLDLSVPVYLKQYGSYFAIINVKTKDDNVCDVKLLKM